MGAGIGRRRSSGLAVALTEKGCRIAGPRRGIGSEEFCSLSQIVIRLDIDIDVSVADLDLVNTCWFRRSCRIDLRLRGKSLGKVENAPHCRGNGQLGRRLGVVLLGEFDSDFILGDGGLA